MNEEGKLRFAGCARPFHVVLVEPEIPQNTGNIGRLCTATGSHLHLVGRLGFDIGMKAVRRAGLDYWRRLSLRTHPDFDSFLDAVKPTRTIVLSAWGMRSYLDAPWEPGAALVFGGESKGLARQLLDRFADRVHAIPTMPGNRSLNLASAAAIVLYEGLRSTGALGTAGPFVPPIG